MGRKKTSEDGRIMIFEKACGLLRPARCTRAAVAPLGQASSVAGLNTTMPGFLNSQRGHRIGTVTIGTDRHKGPSFFSGPVCSLQ